MKTGRFVVLSAMLLSGAAFAQEGTVAPADVPQAQSQWYRDGQARIQEMLTRTQNTNRARNVILFVADGNGVGTNYAIRLFDGQQQGNMGDEHLLPYESFPNLALVKTYNINAQTPDSAPTAGAMNTGVKQRFNLINLGEDGRHDRCASEEGNRLTTFAEMLQEGGRSVGIVSTARLTHATPAAVFAKTANRNWESEAPEGCADIATQLIDQMEAGVVDLALGGGGRAFFPEGGDGNGIEGAHEGNRADGVNLVERAIEAGAAYVHDAASLAGLGSAGDGPVLGLFGASHMSYETDRPEGEPSLTDLTRAAIERLQGNENGFYLEIEAGRVDHANHGGNAYRMLTDGQEFARAVALADELTDDEDTLIIVTADHEHAIAFNGYCGRGTPVDGLCFGVDAEGIEHTGEPVLADDGRPYTVIGYLNGPGSVLKPEVEEATPATTGSAAQVQSEQATAENEVAEPVSPVFSGSRPAITQDEASDPDHLQQALIPLSSETHSGEDVAVYAKGPWAHLFDGVIEQNYIFHVMRHAALDTPSAEVAPASGNP